MSKNKTTYAVLHRSQGMLVFTVLSTASTLTKWPAELAAWFGLMQMDKKCHGTTGGTSFATAHQHGISWGRMARAQGRGRRRLPGPPRKNTVSPSGQGHWWNDCVGRSGASGEDSKCTKSPGSEKAKSDNTTKGSRRLLKGNFGWYRDGGGLWWYKKANTRCWKVSTAGRPE